MSHSDRQLMNALREVIATEMRQQIAIEVDARLKERFNYDFVLNAVAAEVKNFEIENYRESIETIISEYINYNVTVNIEA